MSFSQTDPQNHQSENTWFTPKAFIEALGPFDMDPCTMSTRPFDAAFFKNVEYDRGEDGLVIPWCGDVWLNPPYGKEIHPFVDKFIDHRKGVMLIFARMGSVSIQKVVKAGAMLYCLRRRVKFIDKKGVSDTNAGTDSCFVFFDKKYIERAMKFEGLLMSEHIL